MFQIISGAIFGFSIAIIEYIITNKKKVEIKPCKQKYVSNFDNEPDEPIMFVDYTDPFEEAVFENGASLEELDDIMMCEEDR